MISRRYLLGGGAALAGGAAFLAFGPLGADDRTTLTVSEAHAAAAAGDILLVDIRRPDEWAATGIPASGVPLDMRRADFIEALAEVRASANQPVAVICARGVRSARLTRMLEQAGVGPIIDVPEGMLGSLSGPGWLKSDLPLKEPPA